MKVKNFYPDYKILLIDDNFNYDFVDIMKVNYMK